MSNRYQEPPRQNQWILWNVGLAGIFALLFVCGVAALIARSQLGAIFENPSADLPPPPARESLLPTEDASPVEAAETPVAEIENSSENAPLPTGSAPVLNTDGPIATATLSKQIRPTSEPSEPIDTAPPQQPIATVTIPPGGSVTALNIAQPFVIDGDLSGWANIPSYASTFRIYTQDGWDGTDDSEAFWRFAWDSQTLYFAVMVTDDTHVQTQTGNNIFRGDSLEMQIDTDKDGDYGPGLNPDDYQIIISPGNFSTLPPSAFRFQGTSDGQMLDAVGHSIKVISQQTTDGYVLEGEIPWRDINMRPQNGMVLGIALSLNDNDTPGTARQEVMKSHVASRTYRNPNTWGIMILANDN